MVEVAQVFLQIFQVGALGDIIRVFIEMAEPEAVVLPIGEAEGTHNVQRSGGRGEVNQGCKEQASGCRRAGNGVSIVSSGPMVISKLGFGQEDHHDRRPAEVVRGGMEFRVEGCSRTGLEATANHLQFISKIQNFA